jgi:hypothetical protein
MAVKCGDDAEEVWGIQNVHRFYIVKQGMPEG